MTIQKTKQQPLDWRTWSAVAAEVEAHRPHAAIVAPDSPPKRTKNDDPHPSSLAARMRAILDRHGHLAGATPETTRNAARLARGVESVREPLASLVFGLRRLDETAARDDESTRYSALCAQLDQVVRLRRAVDLAGPTLTTFPVAQLDALENALKAEISAVGLPSVDGVPADLEREYRSLSEAMIRTRTMIAESTAALDEQSDVVDQWDHGAREAVGLAVDTVVDASSDDVDAVSKVARSTLEAGRPDVDTMFDRIRSTHATLSQRIQEARDDLRDATRSFDRLAALHLGGLDNRPEMTNLKHRLATATSSANGWSADLERSLDELETKSLSLTQRRSRSEDNIDDGIVQLTRRAAGHDG